jgi:hypothetical protein
LGFLENSEEILVGPDIGCDGGPIDVDRTGRQRAGLDAVHLFYFLKTIGVGAGFKPARF